MKKRVKILQSISGTGDPSPGELQRKYDTMRRTLQDAARAARNMGRPGRSDGEIEALVAEEKRKDDAIPRVAGFTHPFSFKPGDEVSIDAELAEKWETCGLCMILTGDKKAAA